MERISPINPLAIAVHIKEIGMRGGSALCSLIVTCRIAIIA